MYSSFSVDAAPPAEEAEGGASGSNTVGGKYVPPSLRAGARGAGETMGGRGRDDYPTLRVTNLSEETEEEDLWGIFNQFGRVHRIFMGRDQVTGECKGFAFVSYESRHDAEAAIKRVHGYVFRLPLFILRAVADKSLLLQNAFRTSHPVLPVVGTEG